ncbi:HD domain-containing protein [Vallitalea okinawensis]|uniref:HD domain-containing protein n=1 Tax=Vallitalea okinawensis TaxID=2078660 RepID=UPI000CFC24FA|nr:HD domain-containing protein [Vallitalea okinawensis]
MTKDTLRHELNKILISNRPSHGIRRIMDDGTYTMYGLDEIAKCKGFQQNNPHHDKDVFEHIMTVLDLVEPKLELRLAALFHDMGKPETYTKDEKGVGHFYTHHKVSAKICREVMTQLNYSKQEIDYVSELVYWHMIKHNTIKTKTIRKFIKNIGDDKLEDLFKLQRADISGGKPPHNYEQVDVLQNKCNEVIHSTPPLSIKDLEVDGHDMMILGYKGSDIGKCLNYLLDIVIKDDDKNEKEALIDLAKKFKEN